MVDRLRLQIAGTEEGTIAWSIPEIHVYELADPQGGWPDGTEALAPRRAP
jgi:hypothetical protein